MLTETLTAKKVIQIGYEFLPYFFTYCLYVIALKLSAKVLKKEPVSWTMAIVFSVMLFGLTFILSDVFDRLDIHIPVAVAVVLAFCFHAFLGGLFFRKRFTSPHDPSPDWKAGVSITSLAFVIFIIMIAVFVFIGELIPK
jgi:phosphate/sulfate permease